MEELAVGGEGFGVGNSHRPALPAPPRSTPPHAADTGLVSLSQGHRSICALPPLLSFTHHKATPNN